MGVIEILCLFIMLFVALMILILASATTRQSDSAARQEARLARLERRVELILRHLGVEDEAPAGEAAGVTDEFIHAYILQGQKIQAIKLYREQYRVGLKEAKDAVEALEAELKAGARR